MEIFFGFSRLAFLVLLALFLLELIRVLNRDINRRAAPGPDEVLVRVEFISGDDMGKVSVFPIREGLTIGRSEENRCVIRDPFVSTFHATVIPKGRDLILTDQKSRNGTIHNDVKLDPGQQVRLKTGDKIVIGPAIITVAPDGGEAMS